MSRTKLSTLCLTSCSLLAFGAPALAQTAEQQPPTTGTTAPQEGSTARTANPDSAAAGDVVVTAQRRKERVVDVPISISVANQAQLERQQVNSLGDLNRIAPSLEIQQAPGQNTGGGGSIRGIGTQTFSPGAVAAVGVVVDQVSQGNANISDLFDVARIEVLKGPQGTLFGLTTSAGVINITTNAPDPKGYSGRIRTELSNEGTAGSKYGQQVVQAVVNMPTGEDSALRLSAVANLRQGPLRDATTGDFSDVNHYAGRARWLWQPSAQLTVNLIGDYAGGYVLNTGDFFTLVAASGPVLGGPFPDPIGETARLASCGVTVGQGNRDFCTRQPISGHDRNYGLSLQVDYDLGPVAFTSISAYRGGKSTATGSNIFRADPLQLQITGGPTHNTSELYTQEFRLSSPTGARLEYTVGAFASHQTAITDPSTFSVKLSPFPGLTIPLVNSPGARNDVTDQSLAGFGQATYHATDQLRLIAGARLTHAQLKLDRLDLTGNVGSTQSLDTTNASYRFGAQYDFTRNTMAYATASRGFKTGQIAIPALPLLPYVVRPEIPTAYEVGVKSTLLGGWVMDLNAFDQKVKDFQAQQCTSNPATAALSCVQTNISEVTSKGAEIDLFGRVFRGLNVNTGLIYTDVRYPKNFLGTDGTNIGGSQLAYAPKWKFTFSGEYEHALNEDFRGFIGGDAIYKTRIRYEANSRALSTYPDHWTVGGRIGLRDARDRYSLSVFVRNLFDEHEPILLQTGFPTAPTEVGAIYGPQSFRQVGVQLEGRF